ncbi:MAG: acetylxylan esterase [Ruminococcaceae bacterium]|nr:acetylxylan esterase [Oscillospiraceae bacterium]
MLNMKSAYEHNKELIQKVTPAMSYNGCDFQAWKTAARRKLAQLLGMDRFEKVNPELDVEYQKKLDGATEIRFTFQSEAGYRVPCHLLLPDGVEKPPLMICLQGHSKGMHISLGRPKYEGDEHTMRGGDRDFCVRAVKEGFAAIALEQRNFGECGGSEKGPACLESSMTALLMGRTTVGERVWDVSRLIDVIEAEFADQVDRKKIGCMGNSGGGTSTAYVAALEDRITLAMPSCAMCTFKDSIGAMSHCCCNYVPTISEYFDMNDLIAMAYPKYYVQVSGIEDKIFPLFGAEQVFEKGREVYEAFGQGHRCTLVRGVGGHRFYADDAWPIVHQYFGV